MSLQISSFFPFSFSKPSLKTTPIIFNFRTVVSIKVSQNYNTVKMSSTTTTSNNGFNQNVLVLRHGDRMDNFDANWVKNAARPWDPPLIKEGKIRAFNVGKDFKSKFDFQIHRVFVSPFLRCVQTAIEVVNALCSNGADEGSLSFDFSKVKVSIEYGLCEMLTRQAIRPESAPKDGNFDFNLSDLEAMLPVGTIDHSVKRIYPEMPRWEETALGSRNRYEQVIQALADEYPRENLLLVTHGEGVTTPIATLKKDAVVYEVKYCAYSHIKRCVTIGENGSYNAESFQLLTTSNETGIGFMSNNSENGV